MGKGQITQLARQTALQAEKRDGGHLIRIAAQDFAQAVDDFLGEFHVLLQQGINRPVRHEQTARRFQCGGGRGSRQAVQQCDFPETVAFLQNRHSQLAPLRF